MKILLDLSRRRFYTFHLIFIANALWFWRNVSLSGRGFLPGDDGDARYTTALYEHWYQFLTRHTGLSQTLFFYPTHDTLVFSDSFLLQGLVHSVFRFMGLNVLNAWLISTVLLQLFSAYSAVVMAHKFKLRTLPGAILVIYWGYNSTMWAQTSHVQHVMYPFVGWILLAGLGYANAHTQKRKAAYLALTLNLILILALSSTYPFIFLLVFVCLGALVYSIKNFSKFHQITQSHLIAFLKDVSPPIIFSLPLLFIFLKIYILDTNYSTDREATAVSFFSPTFLDIFNPPIDNLVFGRVIQKVLSNGIPGTGEPGMGFTPVFLFLLLITVLIVFRKLSAVNGKSIAVTTILLLVVVIVELLILKDARGFSFWFLTFEQLPGFGSLRAISRMHTFQYMAGSLVIALTLNKYFELFGPPKNIGKVKLNQTAITLLMPLLIFTLIVSESTPNLGHWKAQDMKFVKIAKNSQDNFKNCDSFSLVPSDVQMGKRPMYAWLIDAQMLSMEYSKPTLQGYSGGVPAEYGIDFSSTSQVLEKSIKQVVASKNLRNSCLLFPVQIDKVKTKWRVVPIIN